MANSKLTREQKNERKEMLSMFEFAWGYFHIAYGVTLAIMPVNKMAQVSVSIMSEDGQKFRRKVGEYHALNRMNCGEYITIPADSLDPYTLDRICEAWSLTN